MKKLSNKQRQSAQLYKRLYLSQSCLSAAQRQAAEEAELAAFYEGLESLYEK